MFRLRCLTEFWIRLWPTIIFSLYTLWITVHINLSLYVTLHTRYKNTRTQKWDYKFSIFYCSNKIDTENGLSSLQFLMKSSNQYSEHIPLTFEPPFLKYWCILFPCHFYSISSSSNMRYFQFSYISRKNIYYIVFVSGRIIIRAISFLIAFPINFEISNLSLPHPHTPSPRWLRNPCQRPILK